MWLLRVSSWIFGENSLSPFFYIMVLVDWWIKGGYGFEFSGKERVDFQLLHVRGTMISYGVVEEKLR